MNCRVIFSLLLVLNICDGTRDTDWNELVEWVNNQEVILLQDKERVDMLQENELDIDSDRILIKDHFYQVTSQSMQNICNVGKRLGGEWLGHCGHFDGNKFVCFDKLYLDSKNNHCLVYSFGIGADWSFEKAMAGLGCQVKAFDPTVKASDKPINNNIELTLIGLGRKSGKMKVLDNVNGDVVQVPVLTLDESVRQMGDEGKKISYLKIDIEGAEIDAIHNWISSGILKFVDQIGIEFHTGQDYLRGGKVSEKLLLLTDALRKLNTLGFNIISYTPNNCVGSTLDENGRYFTYFDIVLMKK